MISYYTSNLYRNKIIWFKRLIREKEFYFMKELKTTDMKKNIHENKTRYEGIKV